MKSILALFLLATTGVLAQQDSVSGLPPGPLLNRAPKYAKWVIDSVTKGQSTGSSSAGETNSASGGREKIIVVKANDTIFEQITKPREVVEMWHKPGLTASRASGQSEWMMSSNRPIRHEFISPDYQTKDFAGFDWIASDNFTGIQTVGSRKCLVFNGKASPLSSVELESLRKNRESELAEEFSRQEKKRLNPQMKVPDLPKVEPFNVRDYDVEVTAYIDLETRLPVALRYKDTTRTYQIRTLPETPIDFPPDVKVAAEAYSKFLRRLQKITGSAQ